MNDFLTKIEELKTAEIIVVEGKKDIIALKKIGITNTIELKKPIYKLCEELAEKYKEIVILTDLDKEGKKLYSKLKQNLERNGVKVNNRFREFLFKNTELSQIEGIKSYLEKLYI